MKSVFTKIRLLALAASVAVLTFFVGDFNTENMSITEVNFVTPVSADAPVQQGCVGTGSTYVGGPCP